MPRLRLPIRKDPLVLGLSVLALAALGAAAYFYLQYRDLKAAPDAGKPTATQVAEKVGKLMLLPSGESPSLATVQDKDKLAGQAFFKDAQNGDEVLIYAKAGQAIIYRESLGKIIAVGPVSGGLAAPSPSPSAKQ